MDNSSDMDNFFDEINTISEKERAVPKKKGRPKKKIYTPSLKVNDVMDNDPLLDRPARRPSKAEQKLREELLREELRKINGNNTHYFIVSIVINQLNVSSYRTISFELRKPFFALSDIKKMFGNPDNFAILHWSEIDKEAYEIFNNKIELESANLLGMMR